MRLHSLKKKTISRNFCLYKENILEYLNMQSIFIFYLLNYFCVDIYIYIYEKIIMELLTDDLVQLQNNKNISPNTFVFAQEIEIYKSAKLEFHLRSYFMSL